MPPTIGGITIDPQGQTLTVSVTPAAKVYTDAAGTTLATFPATVTTRTSYWMSAAQQYTVSVKTAAGNEIADKSGNALVVDVQQGVMEGIAPVIDRPGPEDTAAVGGPPTGAAGGDLTGTYPNPTIGALRTTITGAEQAANKGVANGYAGLGAGGRVPIAQLASGSPTGSLFIRDDGALAAPAGGAVSNGYLVATDTTLGAGNYLTGDGGTTNDGVIAAGTLGTLTSAAALFPTTIVGQTVTLYQQFNIPDGSITSGSAVLTSAGNNFSANIKAGMTVLVCGGGASAQTLVTTVSSNDGVGQLTLAATATTTVTSKPMMVYAVHQATVSARASAGSVTLGSNAPYAFSAASVSWGTDNLAAGANLMALAKAQSKAIWVPPGNYNFLPVNGGGQNFLFGDTTNTTTIVVEGVRGLSRFVLSCSTAPTLEMGVLNPQAATYTLARNWKMAYVGPPSGGTGSFGPRPVNLTRSGTADLTLRCEGIDTDETYQVIAGIQIQSGTGTAKTRLYTKDCRLVVQNSAAVTFFTNTGTDAIWRDSGSHLETTTVIQTMPSDNAYHPHCVYKHPSVGVSLVQTVLRNATALGSTFLIHDSGSPTDIPALVHYLGCVFDSQSSQGALVQSSNTKKAVFLQCKFTCPGGAIQGGASIDVIGCSFVAAYTSTIITFTGISGATLTVQNPYVDATGGSSVTLVGMTSANAGCVAILRDFNVSLSSALVGIAGLPSSAVKFVMDTGVYTGVTGTNPLSVTGANKVAFRDVECTGTFQSAVVAATGAAGTMTGYIEIENCDFTGFASTTNHAPCRDSTATGTDGVFDIHDNNKVVAGGAIFESAGRTGSRVMPRRGKGVTPTPGASPIVVGANGDHHELAPSGAFNADNLYYQNASGGAANSATLGNAGVRHTFRNTTANTITFRDTSVGSGNLRTPSAASITIAQNEVLLAVGAGDGTWDLRKLA